MYKVLDAVRLFGSLNYVICNTVFQIILGRGKLLARGVGGFRSLRPASYVIG